MQEVRLLQTVDRLKRAALTTNKTQRIDKTLRGLGNPKIWPLKNGQSVHVHTPLTTRARELMHLYHGLTMPLAKLQQRLDVLLHVKWTVKEFDCNLTREIVELVCLQHVTPMPRCLQQICLYQHECRLTGRQTCLIVDGASRVCQVYESELHPCFLRLSKHQSLTLKQPHFKSFHQSQKHTYNEEQSLQHVLKHISCICNCLCCLFCLSVAMPFPG